MTFKMFHSPMTAIPALLFTILMLFPQGIAKAQLVDRVVAVVNEDIITLTELQENGREFLEKIQESVPEDQRRQALREAQERILAKLIDQHLISQEAAKVNIDLSDAEFEQSFARNLEKMGVTRQELLAKLKASGLSEEKYLEDQRSQLLRDKLILYEVRSKIIITDEMIREYYAAEYAEELQDGGYYLLQMGFTWGDSEEMRQSPGLLMADKARARREAVETRQQLLGGADFAELARQKSDLPSAVDGGDIGIFQEDEMALAMREAVVKLKAGEITPVLETQNTFQIFKLLSRRQGEVVQQVPFETVKEEIRKKLFESEFNKEYRKWIEEMKKAAYVKKML